MPTFTRARTFPSSASSSASPTSWRRAPASPTTSRATASGRCPARGASSTTSSSSNCRAARSAATSGSSTTTRSTPSTIRRWWTAPTARRAGTIDHRATSASRPIDSGVPSRRDRPGPEADAQQEAVVGLDHQLNDVMALRLRYVHKQVDRAIEDTGSSCPAAKCYVIANPGEGLTRAGGRPAPNVAMPKAIRDYDAWSSRSTSASRTTGPSHELHAGAGCSATTRVSRSRTKTAAPARTSAACSTTR